MKSTVILSIISFFLFAGSAYTPARYENKETITIVNSPIILKSGDRLEGGTFQLADGAECPVIIIGDISLEPSKLVENVIVRNITVYGNKQNQVYETWGNQSNHIRNSGIVIRHGSNVIIENVKVENCRSGGIVIERNSSKISVINSSSSYNQFDGLAAYQTTDSFFSNLKLSENKFAGASFDLDFNKNIFVDSLFVDNGHQGIFMRQSNNNVFRNLDIRSGLQGIFIAKSELENSQCMNNFFSKIKFIDNKTDFIINDKECTGNSIDDKADVFLTTLIHNR